MLKGITRTSTFWAIVATAALASAVVGSKFFFKAVPFMSVDVRIDNEQAFEHARIMAKEHGWGPEEYKSAASFDHDALTQFFAELEAGGIATYQKMIEEKVYAPYKWHVRHFKEHDPNETHIFFTPDGQKEGFTLKLAETFNPGNLSVSEARERAKTEAEQYFNITFEHYKEVEASKNSTPQGREDHTFVYERTDQTLGTDGKYRIKLVVSGNTVSEIKKFVQIPEAFQRRYQEIRSRNILFSSTFSLLFKILYIIFGCLIGGFILMRKKRYLITPALLMALFIGSLNFLQIFNMLPSLWMSYQTSMSYSSFIWQIIVSGLLGTLGSTVTYLLIFAAAEGFDRWAFGNHLQFWKLFNKENGGTLTVLGLTLGGYGLFCIELLLMSVTYYLLTQYVGWWAPTGTLTNPNILAHYFPWFSAVAPSFMAGFWEEFACRALPLAGMILLGRYFKQETLFLVIALVGQALIFGGMHTFYAQQPVYFRIVETFIPSIIWGITYLSFGLLPGIICHYVWDLFCFALPIAVAHTDGAWLQQLIVLFMGCLPLLFVLFRRTQTNGWVYAPESAYNTSWKVPSIKESVQPTLTTATVKLSNTIKKACFISGGIGIIACLLFGTFNNSNVFLTETKQQAIAIAQTIFSTQSLAQKPCKILAKANIGMVTDQNLNMGKPFAWRTQTQEMYHSLLESYIPSAQWQVRLACFEGNVAERAEEYIACINNQKVLRLKHILPEQQTGATLSQGEARGIALAAVKEHFGLGPDSIKELSAIDTQRPARKDWEFVFQNTKLDLKDGGQAHIRIALAGDTVVDYQGFVFAPETWKRAEEQRVAMFQIIKLGGLLLLIILLMFAAGSAGQLLFEHFALKRFLGFFILCIGITSLFLWNNITEYTFLFSTAQPFNSQLYSLLAQIAGSSLLLSLFVALVAAHLPLLVARSRIEGNTIVPLIAVAASTTLCGLLGLIHTHLTPINPPVVNLEECAATWPLLSIGLAALSMFIRVTCAGVLITRFVSVYTNGWKQRIFAGFCLMLLLGISIFSLIYDSTGNSIVMGCALGIGLLVMHYYLLDKDGSLVLPTIGTFFALMTVRNGLAQGYVNALEYHVIIALVIFAVSLFWFYSIRKTVQEAS